MADRGNNHNPKNRNSDPKGLVGLVVGARYEVVKYLGGGGFGEVYEARNVNLPEQRVVIKFLKHVHSRDRFEKEAKILCLLDHPNICRIIDYLANELALVMPYIDGKDCDQLLGERDGPFDERTVLRVARAISSAVAYSHGKRIAHRDIKPSNVMIDHTDQVYLIDFGIAKEVDATAITQTGMHLLTPQFAAPERMMPGRSYDPLLSDIYEIGATVCKIATGQLPHLDKWGDETHDRDNVGAHPLSKSMKRILNKATERLPEDRYQSAADLAEDFNSVDCVYERKGSKWLKVAALLAVPLLAVLVIAGPRLYRTLSAVGAGTDHNSAAQTAPSAVSDDSMAWDVDADGSKSMELGTYEEHGVSFSGGQTSPTQYSTYGESSQASWTQEVNDAQEWAVFSPEHNAEPAWKRPAPIQQGITQSADCNEVTAVGYSLYLDDENAAYQVALRRAYYEAIAKGVGVFVQSSVSVRNHRDVASLMLSDSRGYVSSWEEIGRGPADGNRYVVRINATVCPGDIPPQVQSRAINLLNQVVLGSPRVTIYLLGSKGMRQDQFAITSALSEGLLEAGYRIYEPVPTESDRVFFASAFERRDGVMEVAQLSQSEGDIVIGVELDISGSRPSEHDLLEGFQAVDITIAYRALQPHSGRILLAGTNSITGVGPSASKALANAAEKAADVTTAELTRGLPEALTKYPRTISVECRRCSSNEFDMLTHLINELPDVYSVNGVQWDERAMSGSLDVQIDPVVGTSDLLWSYLQSAAGDSFILTRRTTHNLTLITSSSDR